MRKVESDAVDHPTGGKRAVHERERKTKAECSTIEGKIDVQVFFFLTICHLIKLR